MSIADYCVPRGYSNGYGWFEVRLGNALGWKELPDTDSVCDRLGEGSELWKRRCAWKSRRSDGISTFPQLQQQQFLVRGRLHEVNHSMMPCPEKWGSSEAYCLSQEPGWVHSISSPPVSHSFL